MEKSEFRWACNVDDILRDIKIFMRENYIACYDEDGKDLVVKFNNGQKFSISVNEIK